MSTRLFYFLGFAIILVLLLYGFYLQLFDGFIPCPLCTLQRICFGLIGFFFLIAGLFHGSRIIRLIANTFAGASALLGLFFASRQMWLQHFPPANSNECGVSLQYMLQALPLHEVVNKIFSGTAECTQRGWEFFGFNMAEWAFIWFALLISCIIYLFAREMKR